MGWMYGVPHKGADNMTVMSTELGINEKDQCALSDAGNADFGTPSQASAMGHYDPYRLHEAQGSPVHEMQGHTLNELPTDFNVRRRSSSAPFDSPVSPDVASAPNTELRPLHPTHVRNNSSISSGPPISIDDAIARSDTGSPRPHYVSGFREHLPSPDEEEGGSPTDVESSQEPR
jgi:hypothetical protein